MVDKDSNSPLRNLKNYSEPTRMKLEHVRQNMEKKDALKFWANTNNRGYGFEQAIDKT